MTVYIYSTNDAVCSKFIRHQHVNHRAASVIRSYRTFKVAISLSKIIQKPLAYCTVYEIELLQNPPLDALIKLKAMY